MNAQTRALVMQRLAATNLIADGYEPSRSSLQAILQRLTDVQQDLLRRSG